MTQANDITTAQLDDIWTSSESIRNAQQLRRDYYDGKHEILKAMEGKTYSDGTSKSATVTNWIKYIVNRYVGAITEYQVTNNVADESNALRTSIVEGENVVESVEIGEEN